MRHTTTGHRGARAPADRDGKAIASIETKAPVR
jgi:hypothetical protein